MQFTRTKQVVDAFLLLFASRHPLTLGEGDNAFQTRITYAKKSAQDYTEADAQQTYPVISVYDFPPKEAEGFKTNSQSRVGNLRDTDNDGKLDMATQYEDPTYYEFRFDVSIAAKSYSHFWALYDYMQKTFVAPDGFMLTKTVVLGEEIGVRVTFKINEVDIPRTDGVVETNFEFSFKTMVNIKDTVEVDLASNTNITITPVKIP